jgi:hypothetical protein
MPSMLCSIALTKSSEVAFSLAAIVSSLNIQQVACCAFRLCGRTANYHRFEFKIAFWVKSPLSEKLDTGTAIAQSLNNYSMPVPLCCLGKPIYLDLPQSKSNEKIWRFQFYNF